jgi:hypothetical protein
LTIIALDEAEVFRLNRLASEAVAPEGAGLLAHDLAAIGRERADGLLGTDEGPQVTGRSEFGGNSGFRVRNRPRLKTAARHPMTATEREKLFCDFMRWQGR